MWNRGAAGLVAALGPRLKTTPCAHSLLGTVLVRNTHLFPLFCREDPLLLTEMWRVAGSWALKRRQLGWCAQSSAFVVPAVARISGAALIPRLVSLLLMLRSLCVALTRQLLRAAPARRAHSATAGTTSPPTRAAAVPGRGRLLCTTRHSWSKNPRMRAGFNCC